MSNPEDNIGGFTFRYDDEEGRMPDGISQAPGYAGTNDDTEPLPLITDATPDPRTGEPVHAITSVAPGTSAVAPETVQEEEFTDTEEKSRWDRYGRFLTGWGVTFSALALAGVAAFQYGNAQAAKQLSKEDNHHTAPYASPSASESTEPEESESPSPSASQTESASPEPTQETSPSQLPTRKTEDDDTVFSDRTQTPTAQPTTQQPKPSPTKTSCGWNEASPGVAVVGSKCGGTLVAYTTAERKQVAFNLTEGMQVDYSCDPSGLVIVGISNARGYALNATVGNIC